MKYLLIITTLFFITSCKSSYVVLGYEQSDSDSAYVYLFQRTTFPKTYRYIPVKKPCSCLKNNDTIHFEVENDTLTPIKNERSKTRNIMSKQ